MELVKSDRIEDRDYQMDLIQNSKDEDSLVVMPTGTGKTIIALMISCYNMEEKGGNTLFMAPTKPLVEQQAEEYRDLTTLDDNDIIVLTGETAPAEREKEWGEHKIFFCTPQVVENDIIADRVDLSNFSHLVFDECHHAKGNHAYNHIGEAYKAVNNGGIVTGLTASPGSEEDEIVQICKNLGITNVEVVLEEDEKLDKFLPETDVRKVNIDLHEEIEEMIDLIKEDYKTVLTKLKKMGYLDSRSVSIPFYKIAQANQDLGNKISSGSDNSEDYFARSLLSEAMKINNLLECIETQGVDSFIKAYEKNVKNVDTKSGQRIEKERDNIVEAYEIAKDYDKIHPKLSKLRENIVSTVMKGEQIIVFTENKENVETIIDFVNNEIGKTEARKFVGQSDDLGMTQNEQKERLEEFADGEFDVLVATRVGEEGLDLHEVGKVIFYSPTPTAVRSVQRKGRTGRVRAGSVRVFVTRNTREEGYYYSSKNKEDKMKENLKDLKEKENVIEENIKSTEEQPSLDDYAEETEELDKEESEETEEDTEEDIDDSEETEEGITFAGEKIKIVADNRETKSQVVKNLSLDEEIGVHLENLEIGDYILSPDCAVERKTTQDFEDTIVGDRSIFEQAMNLTSEYDRSVFIIEGEVEDLYANNINDNSIDGVLSSLIVDYGISVMFSRTQDHTANLLKTMARRQQEDRDSYAYEHKGKEKKTETEKQVYVVSSLPGIGPETARTLLDGFGSIKKVFNASKEDLEGLEGIGETRAENIYEIINRDYEEE